MVWGLRKIALDLVVVIILKNPEKNAEGGLIMYLEEFGLIWLVEWSLSAFGHPDSCFKEWKVGFIKKFNDKPLLISVGRSLLFYCTVIIKAPLATFSAFLKKITMSQSSANFLSPDSNGQG